MAETIADRVYALIFNGATKASSTGEWWLPLNERERIAEAVYAELRAGNIEFRLGALALLAEAVEVEQDRESTRHQPERRGSDSEGYGACTGCGDLWPCAGYCKEAKP